MSNSKTARKIVPVIGCSESGQVHRLVKRRVPFPNRGQRPGGTAARVTSMTDRILLTCFAYFVFSEGLTLGVHGREVFHSFCCVLSRKAGHLVSTAPKCFTVGLKGFSSCVFVFHRRKLEPRTVQFFWFGGVSET